MTIRTRDVYTEENEANSRFYELFNRLHRTTREQTIRREMWVLEGDEINESIAEELARNLRATGLFGDATVEMVPVEGDGETDGAPAEVDLVVTTRDRFSLTAGASGFFVGGVGGFNFGLGENNLLGKGDRVFVSFAENSDDDTSASLADTDRHVAGSRNRFSISAGRTEEGPQISAAFERPFWHLNDPFAWGIRAASIESEADFFDRGDTVAEVPTDSTSARLYVAKASGPRYNRTTLGLDLALDDTTFGVATGIQAAQIRVPGDLQRVTFGPFVRREWIDSFRQVTGLDAIDAVEDLALGARAELAVSGVIRDEDGVGTQVEPQLVTGVRAATELAPDTYLTVSGTGNVRWYAGDAQGWTASGTVHGYYQGLYGHTFASSITYDEVSEDEDLPLQVTLGENNGLRGYPAREFSGTRRMRLNFEDRIDTGIVVSSLHLGLVPFFDVAWIEDDAFGRPLSSVGIGARIGSSELFGRGILRIDLAFPLSERDGEDYGPSLSIALGQVFTFFGNSTLLETR